MSRKPDPGKSCALFHPLSISHDDLFYSEGKLLFLMVTIAIKHVLKLNYAEANHPGVGRGGGRITTAQACSQ